MPKIISLLPSITEIIHELGGWDDIIGITHECVIPKNNEKKPRIIKPRINIKKLDSLEIDEKIKIYSSSEKKLFKINKNVLKKLKPDLIIGQSICDVCSPFDREIDEILDCIGYKPEVKLVHPHNLEGIIETIRDVARIIDREKNGEQMIERLSNRINNIISSDKKDKRPRVFCIEWINPIFSAGHWIPEMVEMAGGSNLISKVGDRSRQITPDEMKQSDPEIIIFMPCGFSLRRSLLEIDLAINKKYLEEYDLKNKKCYVVNSKLFFSTPGIGVITGIEILYSIFNNPSKKYKRFPHLKNTFKEIHL